MIVAGLLDQVNGMTRVLPQSYIPYPITSTEPGYVWKDSMFPNSKNIPPFRESVRKRRYVTQLPEARNIVKLL